MRHAPEWLALACVATAGLLTTACEARVSLGGACSATVACPSPYVCGVGGRCRVECSTSAQCPVGERCLVDVSVGVAACSIEAERCTTDCAAGLECVEGQCQTRCATGSDCPDGVCATSGTCVVPPRDDAGPVDAPSPDAASTDTPSPDAPGACAAPPRIVDVDVGLDEVCAVAEDGSVYCWGYYPTVGRDGDGIACERGAGACFARPVRVPDLPPASRVAVGGSFACIIARDESVHCWGALDGSAVAPVALVTAEGPALLARHIDAGRAHVCAIAASTPPEVRCWGSRWHGVLGDGVVGMTLEENAVLADELGAPIVEGLVLGGWDTLALTATELRMVGENDDSELGISSSMSEPNAIVRPRGEITAVAASADNTCVLVSGVPRCWGRNNTILGTGAMVGPCLSMAECTATENALDVGATSFVGIAADPYGDAAMAWTSTGSLFGWGSSWGSLLDAENVEAPGVLDALGRRTVTRVSIGDQTACAILTEGGELVCWGLNDTGQLGRGTVQSAGEGEATRRIAEPPCW